MIKLTGGANPGKGGKRPRSLEPEPDSNPFRPEGDNAPFPADGKIELGGGMLPLP